MFSILSFILSWGGCLLLLLGLKLIGDKKISGFYIALIAEALWIIWGIFAGAWALVVMSIVLSVMYARAIYLWKKDAVVSEVGNGEA